MKMKRMEMRDITVGEYQFKVRPFGAKDATYIFGDVAAIILPILGTVSVASDDKDAVNMEMFDGMSTSRKLHSLSRRLPEALSHRKTAPRLLQMCSPGRLHCLAN